MHKTMINAVVLLAASALAAAAWSTQLGDYDPQGFLSDYSTLVPVEGDSHAFRHIDSKTDFTVYNKLLVERVRVFYKKDSDYKGIDPDDLKALTDYFHQAIVAAVGDDYEIVNETAADVLRVRIALTDLVPNKPAASVVTLAVPFAWVADAGSGVAKGETGSTASTGEASIEMEALDGATNEQVGAYVDMRVGKKYDWTKGVSGGVSGYLDSYSKWDYTKIRWISGRSS